MIKKIIEISQTRTSLSIKYGQLVIRSFDSAQDKQEEKSIPCEDIGVLLVDNPATNYTHCVFTELLKCGAAVVLCDNNHLPSGMLLPIEANTIQTERYAKQINAKEPLKKKLWQQIVRAKIKHQAKLVKDGFGKLTTGNPEIYKALTELVSQVRSGDPSNIEARASKLFWSAYIQGLEFRRDAEGKPPNNLLNYGYMVMRAAVARAICSAGLLPSVGLHHRNKYNAFCLADDLVEPFRGFVEAKAREIIKSGEDYEELTQAIKARLLETLYEEVEISEYKGPLMVGLHRTAASLVRCFCGEQKEIELPKI
ncbi:MAG: type II CRISPR-associated endonuclease Cas1 [Phycisphaerae bacterium]|nr:type II CRISPR-associated endonuclease Cas1 [Phycisphaerae bacterium]